MPSSKFKSDLKRIKKEKSDVFEALMEFEDTKRIRTKTRLNFTINNKTAREFRVFCREKGYNMSAKVEKAMKEMILRDK